MFLFEQVECDAIEHREVLSRVASAFAVKVFSKPHIQHPVQFVFDALVLTNGGIEARGVKRQAGDVVAGFAFLLAGGLLVSLGLDTHNPL